MVDAPGYYYYSYFGDSDSSRCRVVKCVRLRSAEKIIKINKTIRNSSLECHNGGVMVRRKWRVFRAIRVNMKRPRTLGANAQYKHLKACFHPQSGHKIQNTVYNSATRRPATHTDVVAFPKGTHKSQLKHVARLTPKHSISVDFLCNGSPPAYQINLVNS